MDFYFSATPEERIFLCGYNRVRRYGTTQRVSQNKPVRLIEHLTQPEDTIAGLALRYNSSVTDIKRINKLWSNESLLFKKSIMIPIPQDNPITPNTEPSGTSSYPTSPSSKIRDPPKRPINQKSKESSVQDILNRIDSSIKNSSKTVNKLEKESSISTLNDCSETSPYSSTNLRHNSLKTSYDHDRYQ